MLHKLKTILKGGTRMFFCKTEKEYDVKSTI